MFAKKSIFQRAAEPQMSTEEKTAAKKAARESKVKTLMRTYGAYADVSITAEDIVRNEMTEDGKLYAKWQKIPTNIAIFHPLIYNFVDALTKMSNQERWEILATKTYEIVVTEKDLNSGPNDESVLTQLNRMAPFLVQIRKLVVNIHIPDAYITDDAAFRASSTKVFLEKLVQELQKCKSLKYMPVVLVLSEGFVEDKTYEGFPRHYLFPFFPLRFRNWIIKIKEGRGMIEDVADELVTYVTEKYFVYNP